MMCRRILSRSVLFILAIGAMVPIAEAGIAITSRNARFSAGALDNCSSSPTAFDDTDAPKYFTDFSGSAGTSAGSTVASTTGDVTGGLAIVGEPGGPLLSITGDITSQAMYAFAPDACDQGDFVSASGTSGLSYGFTIVITENPVIVTYTSTTTSSITALAI